MLSFLMKMARPVSSTKNSKYALSLKCLKEKLSYGVDVVHADQHESHLQFYTIIFDGFGRSCPK